MTKEEESLLKTETLISEHENRIRTLGQALSQITLSAAAELIQVVLARVGETQRALLDDPSPHNICAYVLAVDLLAECNLRGWVRLLDNQTNRLDTLAPMRIAKEGIN